MTPRPDEQQVNNSSSLKTDYSEQHFENQSHNQFLKNTQNEAPRHIIQNFSLVYLDRPIFYHIFSLLRHYFTLPSVIWEELLTNPRFRLKTEVHLSRNETSALRRKQFMMPIIHIAALIGLYYCLTGKVKVYTMLFAIITGSLASIGVTAGSHRLWSHRSYKAKWQLRLILGILHTCAVNLTILNWAVDHRVHHKFVDTDADPHNSRRGFLFCHILWLVTAPHPEFLKQKKLVDKTDLLNDWVVKYQSKYYWPLMLFTAYGVPWFVPCYFWGEDIVVAQMMCHFRQVLFVHGIFMINSVAHMFGTKPYDKDICPTEHMLVSFASFGDGWHNYHHVFPWDYKNAELWNYKLNLSAAFVDLFAMIGWAYDLKTVSAAMVERKVKRSGDGTHPLYGTKSESAVWGWNDKDMADEDRDFALITHKKKE